jgi:general secretion pathway protein K
MKRRARKFGRRGVAMLLVLVGLAILTLTANETRYNSIVELRLAANARDDLRAHFLANSGLGLARLMLRFQKQIDQIQLPNLGGLLSQFSNLLGGGAGGTPPGTPPGAGGAAGAPGGAATQPTSLSIQLWKMAKIDCYMLQQMVPEQGAASKSGFPAPAPKSSGKKFDFDAENPELGAAQQQKSFGTFTGCFNAVLSNEEERINLAKLDAPQFTALAVLVQLVSLLGDKKFEFLFEKEDSNKVKATPNDVVIALRDWIDEDEVGSTLNLTGQGDPFTRGFSDENYNYDKFADRYRAKNARWDSLDEVFMVHGVNDRFMAAFKDKLTVYPDPNANLNINTDDPLLLEVAIRMVADPARPDPRLADPLFIDTLIQKIRAARVFALFGMSVGDFINIITAAGIATNPTITNNVANQRFISDKSSTYRVVVTGEAGDVTKTITAVVRLDDGMGRLVYYWED